MKEIAGLFLAAEPVVGEVAVIDTTQAADADYNLSPSRWAVPADDSTTANIAELLKELRTLSKAVANSEAPLFKLLEPLAR